MIFHYPRTINLHTKPTEDGVHNEEFHVYANGVSYSHGYLVDTDEISDAQANDGACHIFEEYSKYGIESFGGIGIGIEKMLQAILNIEDYQKLNLYRRKY